jgi:hypothetical protein
VKTRLTSGEMEDIIELKKKALYFDDKKKLERYKIEKLAAAWMKYIDYLDLDHYLPRHFNQKRKFPIFRDKLFLQGEIGAITRYLKRKKLITIDTWNRNVVNWRKEGDR